MVKKGRKPLPNKLKVLRGNPGRRSLPEREPQPEQGAPKPPDWLDEDAQEEWQRVVPELDNIGLLTKVDGFVLEAYCCCYSGWKKAQGKVAVLGEIYAPARKKAPRYLQQNPYLSVALKYLSLARTFASELGLSPASRVGLTSPDKNDPDDPLEQLLSGKKKKR